MWRFGDINGDGKLDVVTRPKAGGATNVWIQVSPNSWSRIANVGVLEVGKRSDNGNRIVTLLPDFLKAQLRTC